MRVTGTRRVRLGGVGLPDGVGEVNTLPGLYRKPIELQDRVSVTESRLMSRTTYEQRGESDTGVHDPWVYGHHVTVFLTWIYCLDPDRAVGADGEPKSIFSPSNAHLQDSQNTWNTKIMGENAFSDFL